MWPREERPVSQREQRGSPRLQPWVADVSLADHSVEFLVHVDTYQGVAFAGSKPVHCERLGEHRVLDANSH